MRLRDPDDLGRTASTEQVADLTGFSRGAIWAAARDEGGLVVDGQLVRPIRCGRALRWPVRPIADALGLSRSALANGIPEPAVPESLSNDERPAITKPGAVSDHHRNAGVNGERVP